MTHCDKCHSLRCICAINRNEKLSDSGEPAPQQRPQADLLEKLDMIKEAVERNPEWWLELEFALYLKSVNWVGVKTEEQCKENIAAVFKDLLELRLKPQRKWVEGWVDAEVIELAKTYSKKWNKKGSDYLMAKALLDCVVDDQ